MTEKESIKANIRNLQKYCELGGFIEEAAREGINENLCRLLNCNAEFLKIAIQYTDDEAMLEKLIDEAKNSYIRGANESSWFRKFTKGRALNSEPEVNPFDRWFINTTIRLYLDALKKGTFMPESEMRKLSYEVMEIMGEMTTLEHEVLSLRYGKNREIIRTPKQIAKMKVFNCDPEYIMAIFKCFEERMSEVEEEVKDEVFRLLTLTPEDCENTDEPLCDEIPAKTAGRFKTDEPGSSMLSQEEILRLLLMIDDNDDEG